MTSGGEKRGGLRFLREVALNTGRLGVTARDEVEPGHFACTAVLIAAALDGARPRIQDVAPDCVLDGSTHGSGLLVTIARVAADGELATLVTLGVAPGRSRRSADALWRRMHRVSAELATRAEEPPLEPWCASRLEPGIFAYPEVADWSGRLRDCIAWTWVRYVEEGAWPGLH